MKPQIALAAVVALLVVAGTTGVAAATPASLGVDSTIEAVPELPEPDTTNSTDADGVDDGFQNDSGSVSLSDARETARSALSTPDDGQWRLVEAELHEDDGYYEFEYLLSGADSPGEAEVRVDATSGDVFRLEQEIEHQEDDDEYEVEIETPEQEDENEQEDEEGEDEDEEETETPEQEDADESEDDAEDDEDDEEEDDEENEIEDDDD